MNTTSNRNIEEEIARIWNSAAAAVEHTTDKIERGVISALRKTGLIETPEDVRQLREMVRQRREGEKKLGRGLWQAIWKGIGVIRAEGDKLFRE